MKSKKIRFTKHAAEKFEFLKAYGFDVTEALVNDTVVEPSRVDQTDDQILAVKPLNEEYALRVVYTRTNDNIVVVTFYPVKRARFNV
jgi:glycine cleavage system pyridoxal-binding protein P